MPSTTPTRHRRAAEPVPFDVILRVGLAVRRVSREDVRLAAGLSPGYFSRLMHGHYIPAPETRAAILAAIGCPPSLAGALEHGRRNERIDRQLHAWIGGA